MSEYTKRSLRRLRPIAAAILIALVICALLNLCACKTQERVQVVEVPTVVTQTNTQHHIELVRDTMIRSDSVIIIQRGDTIIERNITNVTNINRWLVTDTIHDTTHVEHTKVVEVPKEVIKEVKKPPNAIDSISVWLGRILLAALLIWGGWKTIAAWRKLKR